jgi:hypothetical protein
MDKWLRTGNVRKARDNELSTSADVSSGPKCAKSRSDDHIQNVTGGHRSRRENMTTIRSI